MDMSYEQTSISDLRNVDITDDFMFSYVMRKPEICIEMLEYLLPGHKIRSVKYIQMDNEEIEADATQPETQKALNEAFAKRGVRLDVYLDDGKTVYNVEMQTTFQEALPQRARYYQAHIDVNQLERGAHYDQLKPSFVIFICKFDPFGKNLYRYCFRNVCQEDSGVELQDEAYKLFFNTKGERGDITPGLRELLQYMNDTEAFPVEDTDNALIQKIEHAVEQAKQDDDWRRAYMTYQIKQRDAELRGEQRGMQLGMKQGAEKRTIEITLQMLAQKLPIDVIAGVTGLTIAQINELQFR